MRNSVILILLLTITTFGQQRNSTADVPLPAAGAAGTVTLSVPTTFNCLICGFCFCMSKLRKLRL